MLTDGLAGACGPNHIQSMRTTFILTLAAVIVATPALAQLAPGSAGNGGRAAQSKDPHEFGD